LKSKRFFTIFRSGEIAMAGHEIIVVGASAGGVEALIKLVRGLSKDLAASVFIVLHIPAQGPSVLPSILNHAGTLDAQHPIDQQKIEMGKIYIAPPDHHLLVEQGLMRVVYGPKENRHRPAIDALFRSAAIAYGAQVIGVVLTGALDDGTAGLLAIKRRNGIAIVQDPNDAVYGDMPRNALKHVAVDYCVPIVEIGPLLVRLASEPIG
jgi:two-component system chemotaxis response regulator CheB